MKQKCLKTKAQMLLDMNNGTFLDQNIFSHGFR